MHLTHYFTWKTLSCFVIVTLLHSLGMAQTNLENLIERANALASERQYEEANIMQQRIISEALTAKNFPVFYKARISTAYNYLDLGKYEQAKEEILTAIRHYDENNEESFLIEYPKMLQCAGNIYSDNQEYNFAIRYNQLALEAYSNLAEEKERKKYHSFIYNNLGTIYRSQRLLDTALIFSQKALKLKQEVFGPKHKSTMSTLANISRLYKNWGNLDAAIKIQQEILEIYSVELDQEKMATCYSDLSGLYAWKKDYKTAKTYISKALEILTKLYGDNHIEIAYAYHDMGNVLELEKKHELSIEWYQKAKEMKRALKGRPTYSEALTTMNIAKAHNYIADQKSSAGITQQSIQASRNLSEKYYRDTHKLFEQTIPKDHMRYIELWLSEGNCFLAQQDTARAHDVFSKAYQRAYEKGVEKSYDRSLSCINLARTEPELERALMLCQQGLWELSYDWEFDDYSGNPKPEQVFYDNWTLQLFQLKTELLSKAIETYSQKSTQFLSEGLHTVKAADHLLNSTRESLLTKAAKLDLASQAHSLYSQGLQFVNMQNEDQDLEQALLFMEKNKGLILLEALHSGNRLSMKLIPDSVSFQLKNLKDQIAKLNTQQNQLGSKNKLYEINARLFDLEKELNDLHAHIRDAYPVVEKIENQSLILPLSALQSKLEENELVYEYFQSDDALFILRISPKEADLYKCAQNEYEDLLDDLLELINDPAIAQNQSNAPGIWERYIKAAHSLFHILLPDYAQNDQLLIIPDSKLNYLPFEVLLREMPAFEEINYSKLDYLLKSARIRYAFSASLHFAEASNDEHTQNDLLAIAPRYADKADGFIASRKGFTELQFAADEVRSVSHIMGGSALLDRQATKSAFKEKAPQYNLVHLAMHAYTHDTDPMLSGLVFSDTSNYKADILYAYELYNMNLNNELMVLSACNTGLGQYSEGEGVMSLARGFSYAGVQDIVMSLWQANDETTKEIMTLFYKNLKDGQGKSAALSNAKLEFLNTGSNPFPHYWATFVLLGSDTPVSVVSQSHFTFIMVIAAVVVLLLLALRKMYNL